MFSYPRKSAQRYGLFFTLPILYVFLFFLAHRQITLGLSTEMPVLWTNHVNYPLCPRIVTFCGQRVRIICLFHKNHQFYGNYFKLLLKFLMLSSVRIYIYMCFLCNYIWFHACFLYGNHPKNEKSAKKLKIFAKRFGSLKFVRTFAIPKQSGGGEMVDTLL